MSVPHNQARYGELWPQERISTTLAAIELIKPYVILSGGWAWHFMTPAGHAEFKHAHDHKDADIFVEPQHLATVMGRLQSNGFGREWTRHDGKKGSENFYRYIKMVDTGGKPIKVMLDLFVEPVSFVEAQGVRVVEPTYLLSLYGVKHESEHCFSVQIARRLLAQGISPVGHAQMADYDQFIKTGERA
jgi:hypothetical protein